MNKHIELVKKWLADNDSVSIEELKANADAAYAADAYAADAASYAAAYAADAASYAAAYAADAAYDVAYYIKRYEELTK